MKKMLITICLVVTMLLVVPAKGITPLKMKSTSQQGEVVIGGNYSESKQDTDNLCFSNSDEKSGGVDNYYFSVKTEIPKFKLSTISLSYGVTDDFEIFASFGSIDMTSSRANYQKDKDNWSYESGGWSGNCNNSYTWSSEGGYSYKEQTNERYDMDTNLFGIGMNAKLHSFQKSLSLNLGGQIDWARLTGNLTRYSSYNSTSYHRYYNYRVIHGNPVLPSDSYEENHYHSQDVYESPKILEFFEGKLALTLNYSGKNLAVYGGPVVNLLTGEIKSEGCTYADSEFHSVDILGCVGGSYQITKNLSVNSNCLIGNNTETYGGGLNWKF